MKYNIIINQKGLFEDKEITLTEASVLGWIHDFCGSNNRKINSNKVDGWTLVRGQFLVDDMPLLRIKSRSGGTRLLKRVEELGYIEIRSEPRKLYIKTTSKLDNLYFEVEASEKQDEALEEEVGASKHQTCSSQATYHYTNNNTNTYTNIIEDTQEKILDDKVTFPTNRGTSAVDRLLYLYGKLYFKNRQVIYKPNYGADKKILKNMLDLYSEIQIGYLICIFYNWYGLKGDDSRAYENLCEKNFPLPLFSYMKNNLEVYSRNILSAPFDDDKLLLEEVLKILSRE